MQRITHTITAALAFSSQIVSPDAKFASNPQAKDRVSEHEDVCELPFYTRPTGVQAVSHEQFNEAWNNNLHAHCRKWWREGDDFATTCNEQVFTGVCHGLATIAHDSDNLEAVFEDAYSILQGQYKPSFVRALVNEQEKSFTTEKKLGFLGQIDERALLRHPNIYAMSHNHIASVRAVQTPRSERHYLLTDNQKAHLFGTPLDSKTTVAELNQSKTIIGYTDSPVSNQDAKEAFDQLDKCQKVLAIITLVGNNPRTATYLLGQFPGLTIEDRHCEGYGVEHGSIFVKVPRLVKDIKVFFHKPLTFSAAASQHPELLTALLPNRSQVNQTFMGRSLLFECVGANKTQHVKELIALDANLEAKSPKTNQTALAAAVDLGHTKIAMDLLDAGAKPDTPLTDQNMTAIFHSLNKKNHVLTIELLKHGANPLWQNVNGIRPVDIAFGQDDALALYLLLSSANERGMLKEAPLLLHTLRVLQNQID